METYSHFFTTLYDEPAAAGRPGGLHHSVLRAVVRRAPSPSPLWFHDFAIMWDGDHDRRVIWIAEKMLERDLLAQALMVGEYKGSLTVLTAVPQPAGYAERIEEISTNLPSDSFSSTVETLSLTCPFQETDRKYLVGVAALWGLGTKAAAYATAPFEGRFVWPPSQPAGVLRGAHVNLFATLAKRKAGKVSLPRVVSRSPSERSAHP